MGASDETTHLGLPLFGDDDKPTWRGDVNDTHRKIDEWSADVQQTVDLVSDANAANSAEIRSVADLARAALPRADYTAASVKAHILSVDGEGSGFDADLLDGNQGSYYAAKADLAAYPTTAQVSTQIEQALAERATNGRKDCVIVGSSNATPGTWTGKFCAMWGLRERNFAVGGGAYTGGGMLNMLQNAANSTAFKNEDVGVVIVCDASNDIRAKVDITVLANSALVYARATFPNARILVVPVIWPADPINDVLGVPGGYQGDWPVWLTVNCEGIKEAAAANGCEFVEDSWTWLTGRQDWMTTTEVHPNGEGHTQIARWISKHMRGESTRGDSPWVRATYESGFSSNTFPHLMGKRTGWDVSIIGGVYSSAGVSGSLADVAKLPLHLRPSYQVEVAARFNGYNADAKAVSIYPNGVVRMWGGFPAEGLLNISGAYRVS